MYTSFLPSKEKPYFNTFFSSVLSFRIQKHENDSTFWTNFIIGKEVSASAACYSPLSNVE